MYWEHKLYLLHVYPVQINMPQTTYMNNQSNTIQYTANNCTSYKQSTSYTRASHLKEVVKRKLVCLD